MKINKKYAQKLKTRSELILSALKLLGEDKSLDSLSLREVAKEAGIAPAAFYRHFKDMEELGQVLVEEVSSKLSSMLKDARKNGNPYKSTLKDSIEIFFSYVNSNRNIFQFIVRESIGGSKKIRKSIKQAISHLALELKNDLLAIEKTAKIPTKELGFITEFVVTTMFMLAGEFLDIEKDDKEQYAQICRKSIKQLLLIYRGGSNYRFSNRLASQRNRDT